MHEMQPGRWKTRNGGEAIVEENIGEHLSDKRRPWVGWLVRHSSDGAHCPVLDFWTDTGRWSLQFESCWDLVEYVGPVVDRERHGIPEAGRHRWLAKISGKWRK